MSSAIQLSSQPSVVSAPQVASPAQSQVCGLEDQLVKSTGRTPTRHCIQEFGTRVGLLPRMPVDQVIGPVGTSGSVVGGALIGLGLGLLIWGPLGITALAVSRHPYHSVVRGVLFLALGIPGFTAIGAAIGACVGSGSGKDI